MSIPAYIPAGRPPMRHSPPEEAGDVGDAPPPTSLLLIREMAAAILLPASFVAFCAEGLFLAVADGLDPVAVDAGSGQCGLHCTGALVTQGQIVVGRSALVAVPLNRNVDVGMLIEELRVGLHRTLLIAANGGLVVVEINILHVLTEQVFGRYRRSRGRRRGRLRSRKPRHGFLGSARSFGGQVIGHRIGGRHALRAVRLHRANAIDRHVGGVAGLPGQRRRLSCLNGVGTYRNRSGWLRRWGRWRWRWRRCLLLAGAQHHYGTQHDYQCKPLHASLLHFIPPATQKACPQGQTKCIYYFQLQFGWVLRPVKVSCWTLLPSASIVQISSLPDRLDLNTIFPPSRDQ